MIRLLDPAINLIDIVALAEFCGPGRCRWCVTMLGGVQARQGDAAPAVQVSDDIFECPVTGRAGLQHVLCADLGQQLLPEGLLARDLFEQGAFIRYLGHCYTPVWRNTCELPSKNPTMRP